MNKDIFLGFGIAAMFASLILLSGFTIDLSGTGFLVFAGILMMPISMACFAAGTLEGSRDKILMVFFIYLLFFGMIFLTPLLVGL
jgi:hypothetical protein